MYVMEGVTLAIQQIRSEKLKTFFALLGVIIGVTFLLIVVSVVEGMDRYIREEFSSQIFGVNTVTLRRIPQINNGGDQDSRRAQQRRPNITFADADLIRSHLSIPALVSVESTTGGQVVGDNGRTVTQIRITGASPEAFAVHNWILDKGRAFTQQEADRGVPVVVLGSGTAESLYEDLDAIGHTIRIGSAPYRVIGVMAPLGSVFGQSLDNLVVAPARSAIQKVENTHGVVDQVVIQTVDPGQVREAQGEIEGMIRARRGLKPKEDNDFSLETADEALSFWDRISQILFIALPGLVAVALVVGGIVIMNIMLVSVMERTREIGVRKALGARRRDILTQVLIESATLSAVGSLIGVALGIAIALIIRSTTPLPTAIAWRWVVLGVTVGISVGVAAGVYPAARAARLDPVVALRHE